MMTTIGVLSTALLGCTPPEPTYSKLEGVLGYAEFFLLCDDVNRCEEGEDEPDFVPAFAVGSTFDFDVELSTNFPYHEQGANVAIHRGDQRDVDGAELQTVMAISKHSDRYLIDYAYVYLYEANGFVLEPRGTVERDDDGTFVIPQGSPVDFDVLAYHDSNRLAGQLRLSAQSSDSMQLAASLGPNDTLTVTAQRTGPATVELSGIGHTQTFAFRAVAQGPRTNPSVDPSPPRTNPTADTDGDTDTDTDGDTDTSIGGDTDTDTDGNTATSGTGGTTGGTR